MPAGRGSFGREREKKKQGKKPPLAKGQAYPNALNKEELFMANSPQTAAPDQGGMKKTLSLWNFFTIGFGAIIGTGWVLQVGDWMVTGGGPIAAMIAFGIGALFLVPIGAVFGELTAAIPISGGIV